MKSRAFLFCVMVLVAPAAGQMLVTEDFESGNGFSGGTVVADPADPANNVLFVDIGERVTMAVNPTTSLITMRIYDQGASVHDSDSASMTDYGFNFGVAGDYNWGVTLLQKPYLNSNMGYGWEGSNPGSYPQSGTIWSPGYFGGPRQVTSLATVGTGTPGAPEIPGVGAWSTWTFSLAPDGVVSVANDGIRSGDPLISDPVESAWSELFISGGEAGYDLGQIWIDDVSIQGSFFPNPVIIGLPGDADYDLDVDLDDFVRLKDNFGTGSTWGEGDFNLDGSVDLDDFTALKSFFGAGPVDLLNRLPDLNCDGYIDLDDMVIAKDLYGTYYYDTCMIDGLDADVPEPATILLMTAAIPCLLKRKRRAR